MYLLANEFYVTPPGCQPLKSIARFANLLKRSKS
jgi:hypothetical protein